MQCQCCNDNTATIHLTEITNGERIETHLCEACAQQQGLAVKNQIPLNELLSSLLNAQTDVHGAGSSMIPQDQDGQCPSCGMTLKKFSKETLLGCPEDYKVFDKQLHGLIEKSQGGNTRHCGKVPSNVPQEAKEQVEILNLKRQLDAAVRNEDYETAAKLRDEIEKLNETE